MELNINENKDEVSDWCKTMIDDNILNTLNSVLPKSMFDAHARIIKTRNQNANESNQRSDEPSAANVELWKDNVEKLVGKGRLRGGLFSPAPLPISAEESANAALLNEVQAMDSSRALLMVTSKSSLNDIVASIEHPSTVGFKINVSINDKKQITEDGELNQSVRDFIWKTADEKGWLVRLNLTSTQTISKSNDLSAIVTLAKTYPNVNIILSHFQQSFYLANQGNAFEPLRGLDNIFYETAGIYKVESILAALNELGPKKILWGSDHPATSEVGLESLLAVIYACDQFGFSKSDYKDIFGDNISRLLGFIKYPENITQNNYRKAKKIMPGGVQLVAKRPEMFAPDVWPAYFTEARGCEVWDQDGKHYFDMTSNGIGTCLLGYRDPDITNAVTKRINMGSMSSLNPPEELELAELLCDIHPWAEQARFARCGGEICAMAIRIARAATDRSVVAMCGYHGWQDWYLAANLGENDALRGHTLPGLHADGVPRELRGSTVSFYFNDFEGFDKLIAEHGKNLAAVMMEPCRYYDPAPGFLEHIRKETERIGAVLIMDEITIGFRLNFAGAHLDFGIEPDLAIYAKALGNGHPMAAVIGKKEVMISAQSSFISSTNWTESVGPVAALATIHKLEKIDAPTHVAKIGNLVMDSWRKRGEQHNLPVITNESYPCLAKFRFNHPMANELKTLYTTLMLDKGFLAGPIIYPTMSHNTGIIDKYDTAIDEVFGNLAEMIRKDQVVESLRGEPAHSDFRRLL